MGDACKHWILGFTSIIRQTLDVNQGVFCVSYRACTTPLHTDSERVSFRGKAVGKKNKNKKQYKTLGKKVVGYSNVWGNELSYLKYYWRKLIPPKNSNQRLVEFRPAAKQSVSIYCCVERGGSDAQKACTRSVCDNPLTIHASRCANTSLSLAIRTSFSISKLCSNSTCWRCSFLFFSFLNFSIWFYKSLWKLLRYAVHDLFWAVTVNFRSFIDWKN